MNKILLTLLCLALTTCALDPVFAVDNIIVPANRGQAFLKDNSSRLFPASVVYTTDGSGNVVPVSSTMGAITIGTVNQGTSGATPWPMIDSAWIADFDAWKTWADVSLSTRASEATLSALNAKVTAVNTGAVVVASSALPSGASTSALQTTGNTNTGNTASSVASLDAKAPALVSGRVPVDGSGVTQPVSASALPLPAGASTAALQTTGNTNTGNTASSVASIDAKTATLVTGRVPVDPSGVTSPVSVASLPLPSGAATSALQTTGNSSLSSIDGKLPTLVTGRVPVDGSGVTQPVSGTVASTQSGVYTARLQDGSGNQVTSQLSGAQRALDVGVNVAGVQVDPRAVRALTSADVVTAAQGTAAAVAGAWPAKITDATNTAAVKAASTAAAAADPALVVSVSPNSVAPVGGNVASAATDSGNPVKVGAKYNATLPTFTTGQRADAQADLFGGHLVSFRNKFLNMTSNGTTVVKSGAGTLHGICVNNMPGAAATYSIFDNTAGSGTLIATITTTTGTVSSTPFCQLGLSAEFSTGLTIVRAGSTASDITAYYH